MFGSRLLSYLDFFLQFIIIFGAEGIISSQDASHHPCYIGGKLIENSLKSGLPGSSASPPSASMDSHHQGEAKNDIPLNLLLSEIPA
jgi:hypothetical protein